MPWIDASAVTDIVEEGAKRFDRNGRVAHDEGADMLLKSARETAQIGKRMGVGQPTLHCTGLGDGGIPIWKHDVVTSPNVA